MKNITRHTGTLEVVERLVNSANGNPRFVIRVDGFTCRTPVDSMYDYQISNFEGKRVEATIGTHYGVATLNTLKAA